MVKRRENKLKNGENGLLGLPLRGAGVPGPVGFVCWTRRRRLDVRLSRVRTSLFNAAPHGDAGQSGS